MTNFSGDFSEQKPLSLGYSILAMFLGILFQMIFLLRAYFESKSHSEFDVKSNHHRIQYGTSSNISIG